MPQPGFWYMDQLAGKQEKEYNRINEELKNNPTFEVPAEMRKASYRTIKKEFSKAHRATAKRVAWKSIPARIYFNRNSNAADNWGTGHFTRAASLCVESCIGNI